MKVNVAIKHYKCGELVERRDIHNVWVDNGRTWLSKLVSLTYLDPGNVPGDVFEDNARLRYFGLGMGGLLAAPMSLLGDYLAAYPPGHDPNASAGNTYNSANPTGPLISTLERPIRRSGTQLPYPGDPADVWLYPDVAVYHRDNQSLTVDVVVDATSGELIYGTSIASMPISEAGLFNDAAGVGINTPYSPLVAYVPFDTIYLTTESLAHFSWTVRFG